MLDAHAYVMQVKLCKANTRGVTANQNTDIRDNRVWDSKVMDDVKEEQHGLLGLDHRDRSSLYPLCKLVYSDKQMRIAPGRSLERSNHIEPLDHEWPRDGDHLECLGR